MSGIRHNKDKLRHDLISPIAMDELASILTYGTIKYDDRNWENGLKWSKDIIGSLKRHLVAFEMGIDNDEESGYSHTAHILANAHLLSHMFNTRKDLDDRSKVMKDMICIHCQQKIGHVILKSGLRSCHSCNIK